MKPNKAAMKALREDRKVLVDAARKQMKQVKQSIKQIRTQLADGGKTVPEIAAAADIPMPQVLWCISTLRKFGTVVEGEAVGEYFRYELAAEQEAS